MDKTKAVLQFLQTCPYLKEDSLFFNFGNIKDNAHQLMTTSNDVALHTPYIDGSVLRRYELSIDSFKSVTYNSVIENKSAENVDEFESVQQLLDWIEEQDTYQNYPDFGERFQIDKMHTLTTQPELLDVDTSVEPPMAIYRITIQIDYLDSTKSVII